MSHPRLPHGAAMELPGRGTTYVRTVAGPEGSPTLLLLHGWTATADLNWFHCYHPLSELCSVVALDHRGHGRGIRSRQRFTLADCADDAMAVCDVLGIERVIPVGYSMGGPVASLVWQRHRERVAGLVLCATAPYFRSRREERLGFIGITGLAGLARLTPAQATTWLTEQFYLQRKAEKWDEWAIGQITAHDWRMVLEAGRAIGSFDARPWLGEVDVPSAVVITMRDQVVPVRRQVLFFEGIRGAEAYRVDGGHDAVADENSGFVPTLARAVESVVTRGRKVTS